MGKKKQLNGRAKKAGAIKNLDQENHSSLSNFSTPPKKQSLPGQEWEFEGKIFYLFEYFQSLTN